MKTKRKPHKKAKRRVVRHRHLEKRAAIVVRAPDPLPWVVAPEEVTILKNAVCKGATDEELKYCLLVARRYRLDPFRQQIWFVPRWDSKATATDGKKGATVYVPVVSIGGLLHIGARDHKDFGTYSEVEYGPMIAVKWTDYNNKSQTFQAPEWARVEAYKKGSATPTVGKVWWEEIYPDVDKAPMVRRMPRLMLGKCAKAQATRTAYPETGGLLIPEETHTREFQDITPGGRLISEVSSGGSREAAQAVGERKAKEMQAKVDVQNAARPQTFVSVGAPTAQAGKTITVDAKPVTQEPAAKPAQKAVTPPKPAATPTPPKAEAKPVQKPAVAQKPVGVPAAVIPPADFGILEFFVVKQGTRGPYGVIKLQSNVKPFYIFRNHKMDIAGLSPTPVFDLLANAVGEPCSFTLTAKQQETNEPGIMVTRWEATEVSQIGKLEWDKWVPVLRRERIVDEKPAQLPFEEKKAEDIDPELGF